MVCPGDDGDKQDRPTSVCVQHFLFALLPCHKMKVPLSNVYHFVLCYVLDPLSVLREARNAFVSKLGKLVRSAKSSAS